MAQIDFILTGYEHGGTTLLSELFRANGFESGFEVGVLLGERPSDLRQNTDFWNLLLPGWNISEQIREQAVSGDFQDFYDTICEASFPDHSGAFFDKTPRYMSALGQCMSRGPFIAKAVVIHRDPRAVFLSQARKLEPDLHVIAAVEKRFDMLRELYVHYFIGSVAHLTNPRVLFVPFEELVSREDTWLKNIGNFATGEPFVKRRGNSRFDNVTSSGMDPGKVVEFDRLLPVALQRRILDGTRLAAPFFAGPVERAQYGDLWQETITAARARLAAFGLPATGTSVNGTYFEPLTYLIRYPDVLKTGADPVEHFRRHGRREGRIPA
ncbi:sulfotransferase [Sinisalibacter aestuarii]|uniref:Sulfotransferase n=1 Tax=Sinisalibacter aestuarii TaxID=2949426 RepID=A0ABQ5LWI0_9RHOB|nr:sulfotransferase [Sinisalibacter aestuarii]GKY88631.1 hypothetical protein STA1M1_25000 [Sinisalibacter aestuarii]